MARWRWVWVGLFAVAAAGLGWVPFVRRPLSPDEGGLLVLAGQWAPGSSLYGDYWVDRPPALIGIFAAADWLGGPLALRWIGVAAVAATVVLAGVIGRLAAPTSGLVGVLPAATAAVFVSTPLFGATVVNGELLGLPFVLAGIAAAVASLRARSGGPAIVWAVVAGASGVTAFLVKQSLADVVIFVLALVASQWRTNDRSARPALGRLAVGTLAGGVAVTALALLVAEARGTDTADLWEAVVVFRGEASGVIAESATSTTATRLGGMTLALVASIAPIVAGVLAGAARGRPTGPPTSGAAGVDLRWPAYALLAWETFALLAGGSYWLHYLMGLVPGLVVLAAAAVQRQPRIHLLRTVHVVAAVSTLGAIGWVLVDPIQRAEKPAVDYLVEHARPGDTAVVAFGAPNILEATGLESPYQYLWSLPVRVRDPQLDELATVLAGPEAPTWLVVVGTSLDTWGLDADAAQRHVDARYTLVGRAGRFTIYHLQEAP